MSDNITPLFEVTEGWTGTLSPFVLKVQQPSDPAPVPIDLTGFTVQLVLRRASGVLVNVQGTVTPDPDQGARPGQVAFSPAASDFVYETTEYANPQMYETKWKVTDGNGKVVFFPNGAPAWIAVYRA